MYGSVWQISFWSSLSVTSFLITLTTVIWKNFSKYLNYIFQNIQKFTHFKNFPITSTVNYNKILNKYPKNSFTKRGLCIYTMSWLWFKYINECSSMFGDYFFPVNKYTELGWIRLGVAHMGLEKNKRCTELLIFSFNLKHIFGP